MNTTEHKYYVYSQSGMLINRIDFKDKIENHGYPISTSSNGLNFIFQKSFGQIKKQLSKMHNFYNMSE